jgi:hypothetical protein
MQVNTAKISQIVGDVMSSINTWKGAVRAASTASVVLSGQQTIDGVALVKNDTVLLKDQSTGSENGIWLVNDGAWTRNENLIAGSNAAGVAVFVNEGTANADTIWICTNDEASAVVGTDSLTFSSITSTIKAAGADTQVQFNSGGSLSADAGLTYNGAGSLTATGTVAGSTLTDNTLNINSGSLTGVVNLTSSGVVTSTGSLKAASITSTAERGQLTLVGGTVDVTLAGVVASDIILVSVAAAAGTLGVQYDVLPATPAPGQFRVQARNATSGAEAGDTSTLNYVVIHTV